jgi:hypothetical protein
LCCGQLAGAQSHLGAALSFNLQQQLQLLCAVVLCSLAVWLSDVPSSCILATLLQAMLIKAMTGRCVTST